MEKVARPFPEHFQRLRLPIALQVWFFPNRYYNKLHNSLLLDSSAEITSVQPHYLPPPLARGTLQCATRATCGTIRWIWLAVGEREGAGRPLGNFYWIWVEHITNLCPLTPFLSNPHLQQAAQLPLSLSGATFLQQVGGNSSGYKLKWNIWY